MDTDVRKWRRRAIREGWQITRRGPHERWRSPDARVVSVSTSKMNSFSLRNLRMDLRRAGLTV